MTWADDIRGVLTFVPPTDDAVKARHARVREAQDNAVRIVTEQYGDLFDYREHPLCACEGGPTEPLVGERFCATCGRMTTPPSDPLVAERTPEHRFAMINETLLGFALVIDEATPLACGWTCACDLARTKRAAIEAVQLARNAANETLLLALRRVTNGSDLDVPAAVEASTIFGEQMRIARYRASTVIALSHLPSRAT